MHAFRILRISSTPRIVPFPMRHSIIMNSSLTPVSWALFPLGLGINSICNSIIKLVIIFLTDINDLARLGHMLHKEAFCEVISKKPHKYEPWDDYQNTRCRWDADVNITEGLHHNALDDTNGFGVYRR